MFFVKNKFRLIRLVLAIVALMVFYFVNTKPNHATEKIANATSGSQTVITKNEWLQGTNVNTSVLNQNYLGEDLLIDNKTPISPNNHDLSSGTITAVGNPPYDGVADNVIDGQSNTGWTFNYTCLSMNHMNETLDWYWQIDLPEAISVKDIKVIAGPDQSHINPTVGNLQSSDDGQTWTTQHNYFYMQPNFTVIDTILAQTVTSAHWRIQLGAPTCIIGDNVSMGLWDLRLYPPDQATATHTTAPSQIDGTSDFYEWEEFTPTQNVPANTTVSYRFRSSPDHSNWTSWTSPQTYSGTPLNLATLVTSRATVGETTTYYRYLQVETTLTSSDGVANPSISDYTIDYHTNQKPNKPTAQTATIGS